VAAITLLALGIGVISAFVALGLLRLIGFFTNVAYYGRLSSAFVSPAGNHLGIYAVFVPVVGAFFIGLMARYGSEHLSREYAVDPLEIQFVREVMQTKIVAFPAGASPDDLRRLLDTDQAKRRQGLYPVIDDGHMAGVVTRDDVEQFMRAMAEYGQNGHGARPALAQYARSTPIVAYPDEPLRVVVYRMAETRRTELPVVDRGDPGDLLGLITLNDLLAARTRDLEEERHRERVLQLRLPGRNRERPVAKAS
jgi:CBS domain-containing protein